MLLFFLAPGIIDSATVLMQLIFTGEMLPDVFCVPPQSDGATKIWRKSYSPGKSCTAH